ncbi:DNA-3-methyladenine glycosylase I [Defluviimonas sp. WL0024]|uniref:DNA-3-methyladenine glycosylase I n=1 Tax=Albidovulum salinarum TaxID=2984153 RepID=A0ABT2X4N5_9RHOB|nr:DNA-3-methyladenine glycosylase I [Defluviimonas sp. WL0024]MCU9847957.1 DNA-3-methyladenine glycosylase I [Defluviimonas sp. WL0024]
MRDFDEIFAIAAARKGGPSALEARLAMPAPREALAAVPDDRWLSAMAKCLFQAGFHWKVIEAKWDGFETAFEGFNPARVALYGDRDLDRLLADTGIVRNGAKIAAVIANAVFLTDLAREHGSAAGFFSDWPDADQAGLTAFMARRGARLGGVTGQRVLRLMGKDAYILSADVTARLIAEGIVDKAPTSKRDLAAVQEAFNRWRAQSGRSLTEISQVLAMSIGG